MRLFLIRSCAWPGLLIFGALDFYVLLFSSCFSRGCPCDKFDAIKDGKEYDLWVNKNSCKIEQRVIDNDRYGHYNN